MKKIVRLTEDDLSRIVKRVLTEGTVEDFRANLKGAKFPGERSAKYCAKTLSLGKDFMNFLDKCSSWLISPTTTGLGGITSCASKAINFSEDLLKIANCTYNCANTGKHNGKTCS